MRSGRIVISLALAAGLVAGCTNMNREQQGTLSGAAIGAAGGAAIGLISGGNVGVGALVGGAAGAVVGNLKAKGDI
jgi:osmotically inducible lipoprotein OsmB